LLVLFYFCDMRFVLAFIFLLLLFPAAAEKNLLAAEDSCEIILVPKTIEIQSGDNLQKQERPVIKFLSKKIKNKKVVAALLAFPFPFGIVGLHRIYLGTKPYVPVAYIGTLGGIFGIIPLIDFFVILFDKDFEHFENNGKVLMWVK
jgi:TM2 domain-containing membrane protein YozV